MTVQYGRLSRRRHADSIVGSRDDAASIGGAFSKENVSPVYFQWQETDGEGVQEVVWSDEQASADYVDPSWLKRHRADSPDRLRRPVTPPAERRVRLSLRAVFGSGTIGFLGER